MDTQNLSYSNSKTKRITVNGEMFAYRELGPANGKPLVMLHHFLAVIDHWDPAMIDEFAKEYRVIVFDNRGIGGSTGIVSHSIDAMADDAGAFIKELGLGQIHLLGFSMGGFVAQTVAYKYPELVDKLILAGTGSSNIENTEDLPSLVQKALVFAKENNKHHKHYLFFTQSEESQAAADAFMARLDKRTPDDRVPISDEKVMVAHVKAIRTWATKDDEWVASIKHPTFIANGDEDIMVNTKYSMRLHELIPNSRLSIYPNAGHGGIFQYHSLFTKQALEFLND